MRVFIILILAFIISGCSLEASDSYSRSMITSELNQVTPGISIIDNNRERPRIVLRDTPDVRRFIHHYSSVDRKFVSEALPRRTKYLPIIEEAFREENLPIELSNIAFVESRFIPVAKSEQNAVGIWQLTKATARKYGLMVSLFKDERRDVFKSSKTAAKYLSYLYKRYDDWLLAVASYNWGPGNIDEAIKKGGSKDFYELVNKGFICKETREFVSKYVAMTIITRNLEIFGFDDVEVEKERFLDNQEL